MNIGDTIHSKQHVGYTILKVIGQGGQGIIYLVDNPRIGKKVLKWYFEEQATPYQRNIISESIRIGSPDEERDGVFIWPQDIVETEKGFGYIMNLIDKSRFIEYGDMICSPNPPDLKTRCLICYNIVSAYHKLHLRGYCYRDISEGNFLFDVRTGDVVICDNDNVGVEGQSHSQVLGTLEYMAPEVIQGRARPGTNTDLYSLAILLFKFWLWHHPYHGTLEYNIDNWDLQSQKVLYGDNPVFIFDASNTSNKIPNVEEYQAVETMWNQLPSILRDAFTRSFTAGVRNPLERVQEFEWLSIFSAMIDSITYCPEDLAEHFYLPEENHTCWYCGGPITTPPILRIESLTGTKRISLASNTKLYGAHLDEFGTMYKSLDVIGYVSRSNIDKRVWGLCNNTNSYWLYEFADGHTVKINIGKSAPILSGGKILFNPEDKKSSRTIGYLEV